MDSSMLVDALAGEEVLLTHRAVKIESTVSCFSGEAAIAVTDRRLLIWNESCSARKGMLCNSDFYCQSVDLSWIGRTDSLKYVDKGLFKKSVSGIEIPFAGTSKLTLHAHQEILDEITATLGRLPRDRPCVTIGGCEQLRWVGKPANGAVPDLAVPILGQGGPANAFNGSHFVNVAITEASIVIYRIDNVHSFEISRDANGERTKVSLGKPIVQYCRIPLAAVLSARRTSALWGRYIELVLDQRIRIMEVPGTTIYPEDDLALEQERWACEKCSRPVSGTQVAERASESGVGWKCGACGKAVCTRCGKDHSFFSKKAKCPSCGAKVVPAAYLDSSRYSVRLAEKVAADMSRYAAAPHGEPNTFQLYKRTHTTVTGAAFDSDNASWVNPFEREENPLVNVGPTDGGRSCMRPRHRGEAGKQWSLRLLPFEGHEGAWECLKQGGVHVTEKA